MRNDGIEEMNNLAEEIDWIYCEVEKKGFIQKKYFRKQYRNALNSLNDVYMDMVVSCQHQLANNAYEDLLDFIKHPPIKKYFQKIVNKFL